MRVMASLCDAYLQYLLVLVLQRLNVLLQVSNEPSQYDIRSLSNEVFILEQKGSAYR
ncbi:hypothetical protein D3C71_2130430 [compost metagenome]